MSESHEMVLNHVKIVYVFLHLYFTSQKMIHVVTFHVTYMNCRKHLSEEVL